MLDRAETAKFRMVVGNMAIREETREEELWVSQWSDMNDGNRKRERMRWSWASRKPFLGSNSPCLVDG